MKRYMEMSPEEFVKSTSATISGETLRVSIIGINGSRLDELKHAARSRKPEIYGYLKGKEEHAQREYREKLAKIEAIEGLREIREAIAEHQKYREDFDAMMDDEYNDGANPPKRPTSDIDELKRKYPRAAAYLAAESMSNAYNMAKASAGSKALTRIINGDDFNAALSDAGKEWDDHVKSNMWD